MLFRLLTMNEPLKNLGNFNSKTFNVYIFDAQKSVSINKKEKSQIQLYENIKKKLNENSIVHPEFGSMPAASNNKWHKQK